jgi:hypothetical protein
MVSDGKYLYNTIISVVSERSVTVGNGEGYPGNTCRCSRRCRAAADSLRANSFRDKPGRAGRAKRMKERPMRWVFCFAMVLGMASPALAADYDLPILRGTAVPPPPLTVGPATFTRSTALAVLDLHVMPHAEICVTIMCRLWKTETPKGRLPKPRRVLKDHRDANEKYQKADDIGLQGQMVVSVIVVFGHRRLLDPAL